MERITFGLIGAGGFGREVMPFVKDSVSKSLLTPICNIDAYFVETWQPRDRQVNNYPIISLEDFSRIDGKKFFNIAIGNGEHRASLVAEASSKAEPLTLLSPQTLVLDCNVIGAGSIFCANTTITSNTIIGKFFQCNIYSYIAHDCVIGDFVTFAPGVHCNGRVHIEDYAYIGTNAVIRQGTSDKPLRIGKGAVVGMGAVVTKDVPPGATVIGNPARIMEGR
ncbi:acetyltransferase [Acidovorax sp. BL-A-41-H1]|uniref:acetyltransferase n=1 Tax=Acidovorax sp. BL-A-41-H1 TaxID=3421102 RepID=UPI003F78C017